MVKVDPTVKRETGYMALLVVLLSFLMQAVYLIIGYWNYTVLLGNLLSDVIAVGNFFLMGLTVQRAASQSEDASKNTVRLSQGLRLLLMFALLAAGVLIPCFDTIALLIPLFFPRIAVMLRPLIGKKHASSPFE